MDILIFVTLGTQDKKFKRLIEAVDKLDTKEKIIAQVGSTDYSSDKIEIHKYLTEQEFNRYMKKARVVITHAGVGTIIQGLKMNKTMIVVARKKEYKEHVNNHQEQILETFAKDGYIIPMRDFKDLPKLLDMQFTPKKYKSNNKNFKKELKNEIQDLLGLES